MKPRVREARERGESRTEKCRFEPTREREIQGFFAEVDTISGMNYTFNYVVIWCYVIVYDVK